MAWRAWLLPSTDVVDSDHPEEFALVPFVEESFSARVMTIMIACRSFTPIEADHPVKEFPSVRQLVRESG